jgi:hypothetical protein
LEFSKTVFSLGRKMAVLEGKVQHGQYLSLENKKVLCGSKVTEGR